jgi:hypothetical protein
LEDFSIIAALSDGAGSAKLSAQGAQLAIDTALITLREELSRDAEAFLTAIEAAAYAARQAIIDESASAQTAVRDYSCTLLLVALGPKGGAALQVGDGAIVVGDDGEDWSWVFWPQHGEYANTTRFITDDDAHEQWMIEDLGSSIVDLALFSDGLERLALDHTSKIAFAPFFRPLFSALSAGQENLEQALTQFLVSTPVTSRTDDDVSLILATRRDQGTA